MRSGILVARENDALNRDPHLRSSPWQGEGKKEPDSSLSSRMTQKVGRLGFVMCLQNPHLPAAMRPAASPVKITGEVSEAAARS
jgi:hypothetical protein